MRAWSYVITTDRGSAPNYDEPAVTLAICKPRIRAKARIGDLVLGFNGSTLSGRPHSLRWAGIVSNVLPLEKYWDDPHFRTKRPETSASPDNIYRIVGNQLCQAPNSSHDERHVATDIRGRNALIFSRSWHFGENGPELEEDFGLRVPMNMRRTELLTEIDTELWVELEAWLDHHDEGLPFASALKGRTCRTLQQPSANCRPSIKPPPCPIPRSGAQPR